MYRGNRVLIINIMLGEFYTIFWLQVGMCKIHRCHYHNKKSNIHINYLTQVILKLRDCFFLKIGNFYDEDFKIKITIIV